MDRIVIVTGGSRGIGAATAQLAAKSGYRVGIAYRTRQAQAQAPCLRFVRSGGTGPPRSIREVRLSLWRAKRALGTRASCGWIAQASALAAPHDRRPLPLRCRNQTVAKGGSDRR